jgi:cohesin complex subunit SA-1/2
MTTRRTPLMDISNNDATSSPAATGSRRKSGRAVKAPEKFAPAPTSTSTKRKRNDGEQENDASDVDDQAEDSEDMESEEEEEVRETRKKLKSKTARKPAAKKPKVNGNMSHEKAPAVRLPSRPKKAKKFERVVVIQNVEEDEGLFGTRILLLSRWLH